MNTLCSRIPFGGLVFTIVTSITCVVTAQAASWEGALQQSRIQGDLRLRYESVQEENVLDDAQALTLRTLLGMKTGEYRGFSVMIEMEDSRIALGQGDYSVPQTGYKPGTYSVIADPETTELDQGYVQYTSALTTVRAGRQIIALDNHRFVGHVGWRQDRQTFDGITAAHQFTDSFSVFYGYLSQRNRIFAQAADLDSNDHLLNASFTAASGQLSAYAYLLEVDDTGENGLDTYGLSYSGSYDTHQMQWLYRVEYASQESKREAAEFNASYFMAEAGVAVSGVKAVVGYEVLGSDNGEYGFSTPLATLHKFNGWTDQFLNTPAQGLKDLSLSLSGVVAGGAWTAVYHKFEADKPGEISDLGNEFGLQYVIGFENAVNLGVKYASYSAEDINVDTDKLWIWLSTGF